MKRREFITGLGGAILTFSARAEDLRASRLVGALIGAGKDAATESAVAAFRQTLHDAGWIEGRTLQIDERWAGGDLDRVRTFAEELMNLRPDVIFAFGIRALNEQRRKSSTVPIVFVATADPVGQGFAQSLARPGGQTTGFLLFEFSLLGKLLDAFKEVSPAARVALLINPENRSTALHEQSFKIAARTLGLDPTIIAVQTREQIEPAIMAFASERHAGLILPPDVFMIVHRDLIAQTAATNGLLLLSGQRQFVESGGLLSYGVEEKALVRQAASYVDRILRGAKVGDLPIQAPSRFELTVNQKTAKALKLRLPAAFLLRADEVIE